VTEQGFIRLKPALQFNMLRQLTERLHGIASVLTETFGDREALPADEAHARVMKHRPPDLKKGKGFVIDM
jgi:hypothetical protein